MKYVSFIQWNKYLLSIKKFIFQIHFWKSYNKRQTQITKNEENTIVGERMPRTWTELQKHSRKWFQKAWFYCRYNLSVCTTWQSKGKQFSQAPNLISSRLPLWVCSSSRLSLTLRKKKSIQRQKNIMKKINMI